MKANDLYESIGQADEDVLELSEKHRRRRAPRRPWWMAAAAAVLVAVVVAGVYFRPDGSPLATSAYAICEAQYPEMAPYPGDYDASFDARYDAWRESVEAQRRPAGYADGLTPFFTSVTRELLTGAGTENRVCSPTNLYMALAMLAELTDGNSRQQILDLLGSDGIEAVRSQASDVWNAQYRDDGATAIRLANSVWLNEDVTFRRDTMNELAKTYYASSYRGEMGSPEFDSELQDWLNEQTGGLLEEAARGVTLDPETVLALASTIYYSARWAKEFSEDDTAPDVFHGAAGDETVDFMHRSFDQHSYYWGDRFTAVSLGTENAGGKMWLVLPDEGVSVEELLEDDSVPALLSEPHDWENQRSMLVHLSMPKFDVSSEFDLRETLTSLGVTDVFDPIASDFSPMTDDVDLVYVSKAQHDVRVTVDEEGVEAAAFTVMAMSGAGAPPDEVEEIDFTVDRPFLFVIMSSDNLPLFAGVVNRIGE